MNKNNYHIAAFGMGVNGTAMLVEMTRRGMILDAILSADTGGEQESTYAFVKMFSEWLKREGQPEITMVHKVDKHGNRDTLEQNCLKHNMLPSIAYGYKKCSHKFKIQPQDKWCNNNELCKAVWQSGNKVTKYIGYDASEQRRVKPDDDKYQYKHPLIEWGWDRNRCKEEIVKAGICIPPKSSCFFCPNMKKGEVLALPDELKQRAIAIEQKAKDNLIELKGLGRQYAWKELIEADEKQSSLFDDLDYYQNPCECIG